MKLQFRGKRDGLFVVETTDGHPFFTAYTLADAKLLVQRWNAHELLLEVALTLLTADHTIHDQKHQDLLFGRAMEKARAAVLSLKETP